MKNSDTEDYRFGRNHLHLEETDSTNEVMKRLLHDGVTIESTPQGGKLIEGIPEEGTVVSADYQTGGKGRRGRGWSGAKGDSLMFSLLLKPEVPVDRYPMLTIIMAMGVCRAVRDMYGIEATIKWPNDIIYDGRKLVGILTELEILKGENYAIVGTGINVGQTEFPEEIAHRAASLAMFSNVHYSMEDLLYGILKHVEDYYRIFIETGDLSGIREEYNSLMAGRDTVISVLDPQEPFKGRAIGIDDEGRLQVAVTDDDVRNVYAGEVSIGGIYGE